MPVNKISYDELPYTCNAMPFAQPDRLATVATLFGMTPPPLEKCRVLELGCGDGSNIIATAYSLPQAECWGVDVSAPRIARGQAIITALGLPNIKLKQQNILEVDDSIGKFDYIIAHGIYSWVSPAVQDHILSLCQRLLVPTGVAYVSYNTKPGWNMRSTIRDLMLYHTATLLDPVKREEQLKALLSLLTDCAADSKDTYSQHLREEVINFNGLPNAFVFHEFLEEDNKPIYFHQFMERARAHGLTYLGDAYIDTMLINNLSPVVAEQLRAFNNNLIHQEQVIDFLTNRHFRHTLLCHQDMVLNRALSSDVISRFYIASSLQTVANNSAGQKFQNNRGTLSSDSPIIQAGLRYLNQQWPKAVTLAEVVKQAQQEVGAAPAKQDQYALANALLFAYTKGLIELYTYPPQLVTTISNSPQASSLARWEVQYGKKVTNLRSELVMIEDITCLQLLPYLDGTRDRKSLLDLLQGWITNGVLEMEIEQPKTGEHIKLTTNQKREILSQVLDDALQSLAKGALLVA
jgi:methyltransferase-like protein/ubiquinone/menaquinone biosynthesis C-methylase UbiE